jgi:hypothetical protein
MVVMELRENQRDLLVRLGHYIWWQPSQKTLEHPERLIAKIMDIGTRNDECAVLESFGEVVLRGVLLHSEPGWFRPKSWSYWIYRLGVVPVDAEPPVMPRRRFSA